jgi:hypothetical protein
MVSLPRSGKKAAARAQTTRRFPIKDWPLQKSVCQPYENCDRKPQRADYWIVSADRADCYAITFIKGI